MGKEQTQMRQSSSRRAGTLGLLISLIGAGVAMGAQGNTSAPGAAGGDPAPASVVPATQSAEVAPANAMTLLDEIGFGRPLRNAGIDVYGWVEGGYTKQFFEPNGTISGRSYDFVSGRPLLDQATVNLERRIPVASDHFDIGFHARVTYGTDAAFTESFQSHALNPSTGLPQASDYAINVAGNNSFYALDLPDLYLDLGIPLGRGVRVRLGRFEFFKPLDPNSRLFYSTTYVYAEAESRTNTGATAAYDFSESAGIEVGFSRGYNITVNDTNGSIDFIGKGHYYLSRQTKLGVTLDVGPELARDNSVFASALGLEPKSHNGDYTVLVDMTLSQRLSETVSLTADALYANQFGSGIALSGFNAFSFTGVSLPARYYGISGNLAWQVNDYFTLGGRLEWFRDDGGILFGVNVSEFEATIGSTVTPFPHDAIAGNLKIRPEVRYDYSNRLFFGLDPRGVPTRKDQITFGADIIYNF